MRIDDSKILSATSKIIQAPQLRCQSTLPNPEFNTGSATALSPSSRLPFETFEASCGALKTPSLRAFVQSRYPLAMFAGFLLACAFPKLGVAGLGWVAPALILAVAIGTSGKQSFRLGYVAGMTHYLVSLYWLLCIPVTGFPILGWTALAAFLSLFPATWLWLAGNVSCFKLMRVPGSMPSEIAQPATPKTKFETSTWTDRTIWALSCAALWVAMEMVVARIFGGFPWNLLGASQYRIVPLIQIASFTGVYGVSFLLVWSSVSLLNAASVITRRPQMRSTWIAEIALPMLALGLAFAFGFHQLRTTETSTREIRVALIQPSIPQTLIWNPDGDMQRFQQLLQLSEQAMTNGVDLLIWPEAAVPGYPRFQAEIADPISALARSNRVWMIIGADDGEATATATNYYNASFLINPDGRIAAGYRKRSLVIFGEYIPLEKWLPFIKWFTPVTGSYASGDKAVPYEMELAENQTTNEPEHLIEIHPGDSMPARSDERRAKTSVLICFEDNFPHLVREYVEDDTDFLVNITNNGWFGESAAQWQHAANAIFRAVENGIPLVRCSNNGLTCWVDAQGRIREIFRDQAGTVYGRGFMITRVPLLAPGERRVQTFYNRHGDWFGSGCVAISGLALLRAKLKRKNP